MAIYFKFKSEKSYDSISVNESFISVCAFKQNVYELRYKGKKNAGLCVGNDFDIKVITAQTNECYDDNMVIPSHTSVLIQRVPGARRCRFIDTTTIVVPGSHVPKSSASNSSRITTSANFVSSSGSITSSSSSCGNTTEARISRMLGDDFPIELVCPLCKQVMKYATFTSRRCFSSFCDKCIRDHLIISNFNCVCGTTDMLTDYLIPNITVRGLINSMLESGFTLIPQPQLTSSSTSSASIILALMDPAQKSACARDCDPLAQRPQTSASANVPIAQSHTSISGSKSASVCVAVEEAAVVQQQASILAMHPSAQKLSACARDCDPVAQRPQTSASANVLIAQPQTPISGSKSASVCLAVEEATVPKQKVVVGCEEGKNKRKRETSEDVVTKRPYLMRTGFYPYNSFSMDFNGYVPIASFGVQ